MWGKVATSLGSAIAGEVAVNLVLNNSAFNKDVKQTIKGTEKSFGSGFKKIGSFIKSAFAVGVVVKFAQTAIKAASQTQAAWTGLNSILSGTGKSFVEGKEFIQDYISDGLIPLQNAVTAYKNLASRGYSTEQIEQTLLALKDAAAFGRQASYSYGDAITTATEGLKNENSILVDNAGVTKNVAKMWDDYARSIGTTANALTQQQKIQAEVNGILQETKFQIGDAAAYANTFAGKVAKVSTAFYNFKVAVGKFVAPIAELFLPYIEMALNALTRFFNKMAQVLAVFGLKMPDVISKTSSSIASLGSDAVNTANDIGGTGDAATKAAKKIKKAFGNLDEINVLNFGQDTSGSSGGSGGSGSIGGGGGGATTTDTTDIVEKEEEISPAIKKIADKIKELIAPLKEIDFSGVVTAFEKVKIAAEPLTKKLFEGLEWLWFEILVPFAKWTIEDALPAWLNGIAGALDAINGAMDYAKPYLQWLWEDFLKPVAKWTGGKIIEFYEFMGEKLSAIGKWLSDNAPTVEDIRNKVKELREELNPFINLITQIWIFLGKLLGLAWDGFSKSISDLYKYALKPLWDYILYPLMTNLWSKFSGLASILGGIFGALNKLMEGDWKGAGESIWQGLTEGLTEIWEGSFVKKYLYDPIVNGFKKLFGINSPSTVFEEFGENIMQGLGNGLIAMKEWLNGKWNTVKSWFTEIKVKVSTWFETKQEDVSKWWGSVKNWWGIKKLDISNKFNTIKSNVDGWYNSIKSWWGTKRLDVYNSLKSTSSTVSGWYNTIKSWWGTRKLTVSNTFATTSSIVSGWWNNIKSWWGNKYLEITPKINSATGSIKGFANDVISKLNSKLPSWLPKIPKLAQGGYVLPNSPQLAIVGDNKHEGEIITPESKIYDQVTKALKENDSGVSKLELTIYHKYEDGRTIIQKINNQQIKDGKVTLMT